MVKTRHFGRLILGLVALLAFGTGARAQISNVWDIKASNTYNLTTKNAHVGTAWLASSVGASAGTTQFTSTDAYLFALLASPSNDGQYYVFNIGQTDFLGKNRVASWLGQWSLEQNATPSERFTISKTELTDDLSDYPFYFVSSSKSNMINVISIDGSVFYLTVDNSGTTQSETNRFSITQVGTVDATVLTNALTAIETAESTTYLTALQSVVTEASAITQSTTLSGYSYDDEAYTSLQTALETAKTAISDNSQSEAADALPALRTALATVKASATLNMPTDGTFLRVRANSQTGNPYLYGTLYGTSSVMNMNSDGTTSESIFYYTGGKLLSYYNGYYLYSPSAGLLGLTPTSGTPTTFTISESTLTAGTYHITYTGGDGNTRYLYAQTDHTDCVMTLGSNTQCDFNLYNVTEIPVSISSSYEGYTTFYAPVGMKYTGSEDVTVYTGSISTVNDEKYLTLSEVTSKVIPAGQAVLLKGTAGSTIYLTVDSSVSGPTTGDLTGQENTIATPTTSNIYTLQQPSGAPELGFYYYTGSTLKGFKAYISLSNSESVHGFIFDEGGTTGINTVETSTNENGTIYDLQGRRVSNATRGLYIMGGKKVLVK